MKKLFLLSTLITTSIFTTYAAGAFAGVATFIGDITKNVVTSLGYLFLTMAVVAFFWGIVRFIWDRRDGADTAKDKAMMTWGILALFVMFSIWGIITFAQKTLSGNGADFSQTFINIPRFQFGPGSDVPVDTGVYGSATSYTGGSGTNTGSSGSATSRPCESGGSYCPSGFSCLGNGGGTYSCKPTSATGSGATTGTICSGSLPCQSGYYCGYPTTSATTGTCTPDSSSGSSNNTSNLSQAETDFQFNCVGTGGKYNSAQNCTYDHILLNGNGCLRNSDCQSKNCAGASGSVFGICKNSNLLPAGASCMVFSQCASQDCRGSVCR